MPTSFTVFSLGQLAIWDTAEGNTTLATGAVNAALGTYGSASDPLFDDRQEFAPAGTGFGGGTATAYDLDNNVSNDQFSIDGGAAQSFDASMVFNATITYVDGSTATITAVVFQDTDGNTYWAPEFADNADQAAIEAQAIQSLELVSPIYANGSTNQGYQLNADRQDSMPLCFSQGTLISCPDIDRAIEDLAVGDLVSTRDHGPVAIRWIGRRKYGRSELNSNAKLLPVRILAGALGDGSPRRDLLVSRQHRILVQSKIAMRMFGEPEVLIPAIKLIEVPGIFIDEAIKVVEYFHLLFDQHEVVYAEGISAESLFTGPEALKSVSSEAQKEILTIFPELMSLDHSAKPARLIPTGKKQKQLVQRHLKNQRSLVCEIPQK